MVGANTFPLHAQEPAPAGMRLKVDEALRLAERNNPAYRRTLNSLELNAMEQRETWLQLLPRPHLSLLSTSVSWNLQRVGTDPFGNPLPNPEATTVQSSQSRQQLGLAFSFDFADYMQFRNRGSSATTRQAHAVDHLHELGAHVWRTFVEAQERQLAVGMEEELLDRLHRNREAARRLYALAQRERIDLLEADLDVAIQEEQLRQSRAALSMALLMLENAIGDAGLELDGVTPMPFRRLDPAAIDEESLVRVALASSPAITVQEVDVHSARQDLVEARWQQWLPTLSVSLSGSRSDVARDGGGAFFQPNPTGGWDRNLTIAVSLPDLGRVFGNQNAMRGRQVALRNADEALRERRLQVEQSVRTTLVDLRTAHGSVTLHERRVALAEERFSARLESYRLGRGSYQDLQVATDAVAAAERGLLASRYQLERALIALEQALGMPLQEIAALPGG
jgi:outer membrane protein TolC